jgi:hypothetical protein
MPDQSDSYAEAKLGQLNEVATFRVYGRALDFAATGEARMDAGVSLLLRA